MSKFINDKLRGFFDDSMILLEKLLIKNMGNFLILVKLNLAQLLSLALSVTL